MDVPKARNLLEYRHGGRPAVEVLRAGSIVYGYLEELGSDGQASVVRIVSVFCGAEGDRYYEPQLSRAALESRPLRGHIPAAQIGRDMRERLLTAGVSSPIAAVVVALMPTKSPSSGAIQLGLTRQHSLNPSTFATQFEPLVLGPVPHIRRSEMSWDLPTLQKHFRALTQDAPGVRVRAQLSRAEHRFGVSTREILEAPTTVSLVDLRLRQDAAWTRSGLEFVVNWLEQGRLPSSDEMEASMTTLLRVSATLPQTNMVQLVRLVRQRSDEWTASVRLVLALIEKSWPLPNEAPSSSALLEELRTTLRHWTAGGAAAKSEEPPSSLLAYQGFAVLDDPLNVRIFRLVVQTLQSMGSSKSSESSSMKRKSIPMDKSVDKTKLQKL